MEELVGTVGDKDVASYLREALSCYGTGAYRGCVVLTHIALFDSLRRKIKALSPVNGVAKAVSDEIEPLAAAQKVFETTLIHRLKTAGILTQLEAQILEQLNNQRNKAAHPSGHNLTAEEARFVFAEAIKKFISQPIRETSYVVEAVVGKFADANFFPSANVSDMVAVLNQELANLDTSAKPYLISRVVRALDDINPTVVSNARNFLLALVALRVAADRVLITKGFLDPRSSDNKFADLISMQVATDPLLLNELEPATKLRVKNLLMLNANTNGVSIPYLQLKNPVHVLGSCVRELGENFVLTELKDYTDFIVSKTPYAPEFLSVLTGAPNIFDRLFQNYLTRAGSSQWPTSNPFAAAVPALDAPLASLITDQQAFSLLAKIMKAAEWKGNTPMALVNSSFNSLPELKIKAKSYADNEPVQSAAILAASYVEIDLMKFVNNHLM